MAKFVVADDDRTILGLVELLLTRAGHEVHSASDGASALQVIQEVRPDLVLTDAQMPGLSGLELLDAMQQDAELRAIPLVVLSASSEQDDIAEGMRRGAIGYITKPFTAKVLISQVDRYLGSGRG